MWIVRLALRRPYTFVVMSVLIALLGIFSAFRMPTDIFPEIDIPVVSVIWSYNGVAADEMAKRFCTVTERAMTTTVNDIQHIESQSEAGISAIKVFFHPGAKIEAGVAQITSIVQTLLRIMPPGTTPPLVIRYSASTVPILQMALNSKTLSEQDLFDAGINVVRTQMATVQGAQLPLPYGGKPRQIQVDLNPEALFAKGLSATDVSAAISAQNLVLPAGSAKIGEREYSVRLNSAPEAVEALNDLPIKQINGATVYVRDVAQVRDGSGVQLNMVRVNGHKSALLTVLKAQNASTLDIVARVKKRLEEIRPIFPPGLDVQSLFDQSIFVRAAIKGVFTEGLLAACLTAAMILVFLGSWRSTLIVATSIPLSIFVSVIGLAVCGQTLNMMSLGGLALAVGILVDDATVEIENIHRNMGMGKPLKMSILDGAQQIAVPAFVATLSICIVFVPIFFLSGVAKSLFAPLAMAVIFAMMASYLLSRTIVPTMVQFMLGNEIDHYREGHDAAAQTPAAGEDIFWRFHHVFERGFTRFRDTYVSGLNWALHHRTITIVGFLGFSVFSLLLLFPRIGHDYFPVVDSGKFRLHVTCPPGTRLEQTAVYFSNVQKTIRSVIPPEELELVIDNIGSVGGLNIAFSDSANLGPSDGEMLVELNQETHKPTAKYLAELRERLPKENPGLSFYFQPADIVGQILNFGLPAPIDIQIAGPAQKPNYELAREIAGRVKGVPGTADVHVHQILNGPELRVNVDRTRAEQLGLTQRDVANNLLISLSSSGQSAPSFYLNPQNGVSYLVAVQTPQYRIDTLDALRNTPISLPNGQNPQLLTNLANVERRSSPIVENHYNVLPVYDVYANVQDRDLGGVARDVRKILAEYQDPKAVAGPIKPGDKQTTASLPPLASKVPKGTKITIRGQVESMDSSYTSLAWGPVAAVLLVYLLMVVNFQSWLDPFIILTALPSALAGIAWGLYATQTNLSVPAIMGAIMCVGVATSNSILMVTFARERHMEGLDAFHAAIEAGRVRLRPVLMTALAMIIGMLPMSLGLGEGGEQNAPLGRAVIGGLLLATVATLFFVPVVYSLLRRTPPKAEIDEELEEAEHHAEMEAERHRHGGHLPGETHHHPEGTSLA